ncbi:hypothetical protein LPTSP4_00370 [Leptospira ryugenii]|uniref:Uncharacterized protein n=1 Tax=Leptospira ryugenii TaxID=1917863 RepID=A0A2P2DV65_9LEPT|nr:hypothetical protein LPTSP4_00370 [Leptospira ryugenii]
MAVFAPLEVGEKVTVNVPVPEVLMLAEAGCVATVNSLAFVPETETRGEPVRLRVAFPKFWIVNEVAALVVPTLTEPIPEKVPPEAMLVELCWTLISGAGATVAIPEMEKL